ncbi:hypothetical protein [Microbacterium sp. 77mftsu3.1]|uniref:hypothetical protein n=1 Tax=Microbacterium sp. 77mftsu3.1 TaxID=1761802 RepID=UPI0003726EDF|nr:hypothetical protein [Microbacterium sp. 77mftsu3.1]
MSDTSSLARAVIRRAVGADFPGLEELVVDVMHQVIHAVREKQIRSDQIRLYARETAKVMATRAFASQRMAAVNATGRTSTVAAVTAAAARVRQAHAIAELDALLRARQLAETRPIPLRELAIA